MSIHETSLAPNGLFAKLNTGYAWAAREAERSSLFRSEVKALRRAARRDHPRAGGPLVQYSWAELGELLESGEQDRSLRPRAWKNTRDSTADGYRHIRRYMESVRCVAGTRLAAKELAPRLHELIRRDVGYVVDVAGLSAGFEPPTGSRASHAAAHISGASFGTGTVANRQAYYNARRDTFIH